MQSDTEKLQAYANEMGLVGDKTLSLDQLIDSHRGLRAFRLQSEAERRAEMDRAREFATKQAINEVKTLGWFSVERLRGMTLAELAEVLRVEE